MWIEKVLERKLDRVAAPDELWDRIDKNQNPTQARMPVPRRSTGILACVDFRKKLAWTFVAAMLVVVLVWGLRPRRDLVFRSDSAVQIREWVKANAGFDVPLLGDRSPVRLTGARLVRGDVEIACRVGDHQAKLLISKENHGVRHGVQPVKGNSTVAWGMSGRLYSLACTTPEDLRIACLLCHSSSERRIALN
jgi:hypothetical protein